MEHTWRWFGPSDPITLADIKQTGATAIVTALHEVPKGQVWTAQFIADRKKLIEASGLTWSVVESVPVHEDIKRGGPLRDHWIEAYQKSLRNLAANGIDQRSWFRPQADPVPARRPPRLRQRGRPGLRLLRPSVVRARGASRLRRGPGRAPAVGGRAHHGNRRSTEHCSAEVQESTAGRDPAHRGKSAGGSN
jgi:hypothetical protein